MQRFSKVQAIILSSLIFITSVVISYLYPQFTVVVGGLLISVFLTVFIPGRTSTYIAAVAATGWIIATPFFTGEEELSTVTITIYLFRVMLILFTAIIVLYIKNLYSAIQSDKTHMTSLFENATEGIILTDRKGKIILVNPAAQRMFQYEEHELVGKTVEVLLPKKARHAHVALRESFHEDPGNRVMGHGRDLHGERKDGTEFPVEVSLSHYKKTNDTFAIAFIVDITHRKQIENNLVTQKQELEKISADIRKLNAQLEVKVEERTLILKEALQKLERSQTELSEALDKERELNEIKSRFVSMASHEFRTPLSTVLSSASLISKYQTSEDQEKRDRHIQKIKDSVRQLNDILEDFLSLGKLDEGKVTTSKSNVNVSDLVTETVEEMRGLTKQGQQISMTHTGSTTIFTDKKLLKNILMNLLSNAIKFSPENGMIKVTSDLNNGTYHLSVVDNGIGISAEDQSHLFSSFFRAKNATNIQGTGLGLHIVKRYADLLDGEVKLKSKLNEGTTITIKIPQQ